MSEAENELQNIIECSGVQPSQCSCKTCRAMCHRVPCLGTPRDIQRLIQHGHINMLMPTTWSAGLSYGVPMIEMVQIEDIKGGCPMLKNGLCSIHHIKPIDGKLAHCTTTKAELIPPVFLVALSWNMAENKPIIEWIWKAFNKYWGKKMQEILNFKQEYPSPIKL